MRSTPREKLAIASSCCGVTGEVTLNDSAVILLYAAAIGAGELLTLLSTAILPLFNGALLIPLALLGCRFPLRRFVATACSLAAAAYFLAVAAPWCGAARVPVLIGAILLFAGGVTGFIAGWFPLLDTFLAPERRTMFLGRMRFLHQLAAVGFLVLAGSWLGKTPGVGQMQLVLLAAAVIFCGRQWFLSRIPASPEEARERRSGSLGMAWRNRPLRLFSFYQGGINLAVFGLMPLTVLHLKNQLHTPDNVLINVSAAALAGMLLGYRAAAPAERRFGRRNCFIALHLLFLAILGILALAVTHGGGAWVCGTLLLLNGFGIAAFSILASARMMELATPGNRTMAMAMCGATYYGCAGLSRVLGSFLLHSGWRLPAILLGGAALLLALAGIAAGRLSGSRP